MHNGDSREKHRRMVDVRSQHAGFSQKLNTVAPLIPSYPFYGPTKSILLEGANVFDFPLQWVSLFGIDLVAIFASHRLMKKRWLM